RRFHEAKLAGEASVTVWGSGTPRRELMHVDDLASACLFLMRHYGGREPINVGTGTDHAVRHIAAELRDVVHPDAELRFDAAKPDGMPRKLLDVARIHALGWRHALELRGELRRA